MRRKRCLIHANEKKGIARPSCAVGARLPCKSIKCRQREGMAELTKMMLNQGFSVGNAEGKVLEQVAEHYFCSTALGKKPRNFGYFAIKEITPGKFEIRFKNARYAISFVQGP